MSQPPQVPPRPYGLEGQDFPLKALARALVERAEQLGLVWRLRPGTVVSPGPSDETRVVYDGDATAVNTVSLIGEVATGARVMGLETPPAGHHIVGWLGPYGPAGPGEEIGRRRFIMQQLDQGYNFTIAPQPATDLWFDAPPGALYVVQARLAFGGPVAADVRVVWGVPAGVTSERNILSLGPASVNNADGTFQAVRRGATVEQTGGTGGTGATAGGNDWALWWEDIYLQMGAAGGRVQLKFAQANSNSGVTTLRARSYLLVQRYRALS